MIDGHLFANLASYSAQIACVAGVGGLTLSLLHMDAAAVRHGLWRSLLALCVALPWLQGRAIPTGGTGLVSVAATTAPIAVARASADPGPAGAVPWLPLVAALLASGVAARLLWIAVGLVRLQRLRTTGEAALAVEEWDQLQHQLGTRAEIRFVAGVAQPVTFGIWRPVVLLPDTLRALAPEVQRAVVCHELIHVRRRDWISVLAEEMVRAALWFHPAVWWVISRVQQTREEVVDELTVMSTASRRAYIEALMAFDDRKPIAPAAAFGRRGHLFRRVVLLTKEVRMSSTRVLLSGAVAVLVVLAGSWYAVGAFPLLAQATVGSGPGPLESRARQITPENPVPRRLYAIMPLFPSDAPADVTEALVTLRVTLDAAGRVAESRLLGLGLTSGSRGTGNVQGTVDRRRSGAVTAPPPPPEPPPPSARSVFERAAIDAIRQWLYEAPAEAPMAFDVTIAFHPGAEAALISHGAVVKGVIAARGERGAIPPPPPPPPPPSPPAPAGDVDPPAWTRDGIRVGTSVAPTRVKNVAPIYPELARASQVQGVVVLEARIGPDGRVTNARVLRSVPLLDQAAIEALNQWEYQPTLLNGSPVPVLITVTINFTLQ
jgi:TonB family protein